MIPSLDPSAVEEKLRTLIARYRAKNITVEEVKRRIYESDGNPMEASNRFQKWWYNTFPKRKTHAADMEEMNELLQAFADAWNVFPHRSLDGKSPQEKMQEYASESKGGRSDAETEVICGGSRMTMDEYETMLKEMEKVQKPFRKWVKEEALPAYRKFLEHKFRSKKTIAKHHEVADIFLERVLHVGFVDYEQIRPAFVVWEFPEWWQTHFLESSLTEDQVWSSLCDFLWFTECILKRSIPGVWEEAEGDGHEGCDDVTCPYCGSGNVEPVEEEADDLPDDVRTMKAGRNDPCPCRAKKPDGSPLKYKHCHGKAV
ncbi:MAG: hypothetical protein PHZ00_03765 [Candidatus Peribacteraceae bacterium]|nr:hypothetical protein [Candidatus Peribacteraceae bacterium]